MGDKSRFSSITEVPEKEDLDALMSYHKDGQDVNDMLIDDDAIQGIDDPFPDYEDRIDIMDGEEMSKEIMMNNMKVFDYSNLENFHTYNLNVETAK